MRYAAESRAELDARWAGHGLREALMGVWDWDVGWGKTTPGVCGLGALWDQAPVRD